MASTVFYGFVIGCVLSMTGPRGNAAIAAGIVMIGLVCLSRVYLGVHYASDVLAGILEAIAWSTAGANFIAPRTHMPAERRVAGTDRIDGQTRPGHR